MNRVLKVFVSCSLGAGIGTLVALQLHSYFWWIGMLVGGLVGYLSYEFKEVCSTVPRAWKTVTSWRISRNRLKFMFFDVLVIVMFSLNVAVLIGIAGITGLAPGALSLTFLQTVMAGISAMIFHRIISSYKEAREFAPAVLLDEIAEARQTIWQTSPIKVYIYWLPIGICLMTKWICLEVFPAVGYFVRKLFFLIHSELRLLCGVDAAIGAGVGYIFGNIIIGVLAGGIIGVLNYELVSKRLLCLGAAR